MLLLLTPAAFFARLVPWLVLFATSVFAWGSFWGRPSPARAQIGPTAAGLVQCGIAVYGGYFGGGIGFLMLAALTMAGLAVRSAGATKNALAAAMNASAVAIFVFSPDVYWIRAAMLGAGAIVGGLWGAWLLKGVNEKMLRGFVVAVGSGLTIGLFLRSP